MPIELARATAHDLEQLPRLQTVFFFPVGPLEDHGPHLPLGLDMLEAETLCRQAAERLERELPGWRGVLMPAAPLGIETNTGVLRVTVRAHVLRDWLVDACKSLGRAGFRQFVCFSGHLGPKQLTALEEAGRLVAKRWFWQPRGPVLVSACSALVSFSEVRSSPFWLDPAEHGGARDTSVALALARASGAASGGAGAPGPGGATSGAGSDFARSPVAVRADSASLPPVERKREWLARYADHLRHRTAGYWGKPGAADAAVGARLLQGTLDDVFPKLRAVWEGSNPQNLFRSWYSVLPFHKSFFKAYLLGFSFLGLFCAWIYFNLVGMLS